MVSATNNTMIKYKVFAYYTEYDRDGKKYTDYEWWPAENQQDAQKIVDNLQSGLYNLVEILETKNRKGWVYDTVVSQIDKADLL